MNLEEVIQNEMNLITSYLSEPLLIIIIGSLVALVVSKLETRLRITKGGSDER